MPLGHNNEIQPTLNNNHWFFFYSLFIDKRRVTTKIEEHLKLADPEGILKVFPYEDIQECLRELGNSEKKIWVSLQYFE